MPLTPSTCPLDCPDACGVLVETDGTGALVRVKGDPDHGWSHGALCAKTSLYHEVVQGAERLLHPHVRDGSGRLVRASWDEALGRIVDRVQGLPGERILAASYAGTMGLVQRKFPMRAMHALGAVTTDDGLCDGTSTEGYQHVLGHVFGADLNDARDADLLVLWGCDMARTVQHLQPIALGLARRGVPVVVIDVYRTETARRVEGWGGRALVLRPGTDAALALCLVRLAFERGAADRAFLERECLGAAEFEAHVRAGHGLAETSAVTGLAQAEIEALYELLARSPRAFLKTGVGWTRRRNGAMSMRAVCSLAAVLGLARRVHYESFEHFRLNVAAIERPDLRPRPPEEIHHVELGPELESGRFGAVFVWGHNPAVTVPDSHRVRAGLEREDVFVVVHDHFATETARRADVVLPATTFVEHPDVYRSYGHRLLRRARKACEPPGECRSNVQAFGAIARALGLPRDAWEQDADELCEALLEASRERLGDEALAGLRDGRAVPLPLLADEREGRWGTPSGKVELVSARAAAAGQPAMATHVPDAGTGDGAYWLVSAPSRFTHNSTYSHSARHLARNGPPLVHVHPADADELGLRAGAPARLSTALGAITLPVALDDGMPRGSVRVDGLPRGDDVPEGVGVNALVSSELSDLGSGNTLYSTRVDVAPA